MAQTDPVEILNRLLRLVFRSLPAYSVETRPVGYRGPKEFWELLQQVAGEQQQMARRLSGAILQMGGVPESGSFPVGFTAWNDIEVTRVVQRCLELQGQVIVQMEQAAAALEDRPAARYFAHEALRQAEEHERRLEQALSATTAGS